jgi:magnesium transporter
VNIKEWFKIIWKELRIAILLAAILGLLTFINAMILNSTREIPQGLSVSYISFVIALSMAMQVISSTFIGAFFPLLVKAFKGDPALAASPAIATLVDITGLLVYFSIASLLL